MERGELAEGMRHPALAEFVLLVGIVVFPELALEKR